jgi:glycosyltransferase involved in cell wall biosynthesis
MKIAILVQYFPPKGQAGTEIATYFMAEQLARRGHNVHVITSSDDGLHHESIEKGFYIHRLPLNKIRVFGILCFWCSIIRTIRKIDPDLVHAQSLASGIPALISKKLLHIPYAVWGQGSDVYFPKGFLVLTPKKVIKNADAAIALTENMKMAMQKIYHRDIVVVPNGITLSDQPDKPGMNDLMSPGKSVLYVGRLETVKGVRYLIRAMKQVCDTIPDARLIIIGDGKEREMLEALSVQLGIQKNVQFAGEVPHEKVLSFMRQAGVFVLPSLSEGFPMVIIEALACGLPIVASRVGGVPEILTNAVNGYLVEARDDRTMGDSILLLLQDEKLRKKISDNNRQLVKNYTWENVILKLENVYELSGANYRS